MLRVGLAFAIGLLGPASAPAVDAGLGPVRQALAAVKTSLATDGDYQVGPALTPVKKSLRTWIEGQIAGLTPRYDPNRLTQRINKAIAEAGLTCDASCEPEFSDYDARGKLGQVALKRLNGGRYLLAYTKVGIRCGYDESAYLYERVKDRWRLLWKAEQDTYEEGAYTPLNYVSVQISTAGKRGPLILALGYGPWCQSNWRALSMRLSRASPDDLSPKPLKDFTDEVYLGSGYVARGRLTDQDVRVEYENWLETDDGPGTVVRRFRIGEQDSVQEMTGRGGKR